MTDEILQRCTHLNICPIQNGETRLCLASDKISVESGYVKESIRKSSKAASVVDGRVLEKSEKSEKSEQSEKLEKSEKSDKSSPKNETDSLQDLLPSAASRIATDSPSFYMDRRSSDRPQSTKRDPEISFIMKNLPRDITGNELDELCLKNYDLASIDFLTPSNQVALIAFKTKETRDLAMSELADVRVMGRQIIIVPNERRQ